MNCSLVSPAFSLSRTDPETLKQVCANNLGTSAANIEVFALVPLEDVPHASEIAFTLKESSFFLSAIEDVLVQRDQLTQQLQRSRDALSVCTEQLQQLKNTAPDQQHSKRLQKLEDDNKKLRQLLK